MHPRPHAPFLNYFLRRQHLTHILWDLFCLGKKTFLFSDINMYVCGLGSPVKVSVEHFTDFDIFI